MIKLFEILIQLYDQKWLLQVISIPFDRGINFVNEMI